MSIEKRNCDYYAKLDTEKLEKEAKEINYSLTPRQIEIKILEHNLRNILFVLKLRKERVNN